MKKNLKSLVVSSISTAVTCMVVYEIGKFTSKTFSKAINLSVKASKKFAETIDTKFQERLQEEDYADRLRRDPEEVSDNNSDEVSEDIYTEIDDTEEETE